MKTRFVDSPGTVGRAGRWRLWAGGAVVVLLLAGHLAAWTQGEALRRTDAAYRQPPQLLLLQRLLYPAAATVTPYEGGEDLLDDLLGGAASEISEASEEHAPEIVSTPRVTAVARRPYRYALRTNAAPGLVRYRLLAAPAGMTISPEGGLLWIPRDEQAGGRGHAVAVAALGPSGRGTQQQFSVIVSEREHPLGTDEAGRDVLAALLLGTRWTVFPGLLAVSVALLLGVLVGGWAGYYAGRTDAVLSYLGALFEALPALVLLFLAAVIFRYQLYPVMAVLGLVLFPGVARGVRAIVQTLRAQQFVEAAREMGLSNGAILWREIVWHNGRAFLLDRLFYGLALAVAVEVTLSYLRLGIQPPGVSWGTLLLAGRGLIESQHYALAFFPAVATMVAMAGFLLLGSGLAARLRLPR